MVVQDLYDKDFFQWTQCSAALLRAGRFAEIDVEHIAEELEDMGKREQRELVSRTQVLLTHLLKWQVQPGGRGTSWEATIDIQRDQLARLLAQMPGLKPYVAENLPRIYPLAAKKAAGETGLAPKSFPAACPYSLDQILDTEFFPE